MADGVAEARGRRGGSEGKHGVVASHPHCFAADSSSFSSSPSLPPTFSLKCERCGGEEDEEQE